MTRTICVVTGSRADYGLLYWLMRDLRQDPCFRLQVAVTGMHLSPEFGATAQVIEADGFTIDARVEMLLSSDTAEGTTKSTGLGTIGFADAFARLHPDLIVLLGDRFEILAAAQAALFARIPVAHLCGGDTTEGALDDTIRHSITKMSHLHFVTNEPAARRVRQLGEDPARVFNVGSPGIDYIKRLERLGRRDLEQRLGVTLRPRNLLITFHPPTLDAVPPELQFSELLKALASLPPDEFGLIFTRPNADTGGRGLIAMLDEFAENRPNARVFTSLGQQLYLSLLAQADAVVGNSSSGLYEAPSLRRPTVNIGDRQKGRLLADSVISCPPVEPEIAAAIHAALARDCSRTVNPYGDGGSSGRIVACLKRIADPASLLQKHFFDLGGTA